MTDPWSNIPPDAKPSPTLALWVPMRIQALNYDPARDKGNPWFIDPRPDYARAGRLKTPVSRQIRPNLSPRETAATILVDKGIHLHWTLPAAFLHVQPRANEKGTSERAVPDRWLVIRLWSAGANENSRLNAKSWVLDSDLLQPMAPARARDRAPWLIRNRVPAADEGPFQFTTIGRRANLADWTSLAAGSDQPLTAFGPANPAFAAFYPSCRNVFGMHDDIADLLPQTECTYLVAGWFSRDTDDPLYAVRAADRAAWVTTMRQFDWRIAGADAALPTRTMCYGILKGLSVDPPSERFTNSPRPKAFIGEGLLEAVAAAIKTKGLDQEDAAALRDQLQFVALRERRLAWSDLGPVGQAGLFKRLAEFAPRHVHAHERTFSGVPGGTYWEIALKDRLKKERKNQAEGAGEPVALPAAMPDTGRPEAVVDLPEDLSALLVRLNQDQATSDRLAREQAHLRRDLFAWWSNSVIWNDAATPPEQRLSPGRRSALVARMTAKAQAIRTGSPASPATGAPSGTNPKAAIEALLKTSDMIKLLGKCELVERQMPRFWRVKDPFVLIPELPVPELQRGAVPLLCRTGVQTMSMADHSEGTGLQLNGDELAAAPDVASILESLSTLPAAVEQDVGRLLLDTLFAARVGAESITRAYIARYDKDFASVKIDVDKVQGTMAKATEAVRDRDFDTDLFADIHTSALRCSGGAESVAAHLSAVSIPNDIGFTPVFMVWRVKWRHDDPKDLVCVLGEVDYDLALKSPPAREAEYDGFTIVGQNLERGFKGDWPDHPSKRFRLYDNVVKSLSGLVGQSLFGLTDAMGMMDRGTQLPPSGPDPWPPKEAPSLADSIGKLYDTGPYGTDTGHFSPIRGGVLEFVELSLVDTFGRAWEIAGKGIDERPRTSRALRGADGVDAPGSMFLRPRLVQPARLLLRWTPRDDGKGQVSLGDRATSPIHGWIMHSHLDRGLLIHDHDGRLLGIVQALLPGASPRSDGAEVVWSALPPGPGLGPDAATGQDIADPCLRHFVNGLLRSMRPPNGAPEDFAVFRDILSNHEDRAGQPHEKGLRSVLVGRPLALVGASLRLEIDGLPLTGYAGQALDVTDWQLDAQDYLNVKFPVRLGDLQLGPDGLIGYFLRGETEDYYRTMCLTADRNTAVRNKDGKGYFDTKEPHIELCRTPDNQPGLGLTLLMDPTAGVHIVSGLLPTQFEILPPPLIARASAWLQPRFLVAPVLGEWGTEPQGPRIPLPTNGDREWEWNCLWSGKRPPPRVLDPKSDAGFLAAPAIHEGWLGALPPPVRKPDHA